MIDKDLQTSLQFPRKGLHVLCCFSVPVPASPHHHTISLHLHISHHTTTTVEPRKASYISIQVVVLSSFLAIFFLLGMLNAIIMKRKKNRVCLAIYTLKHYGKENNACIFKATPITEQKNMKLCKITEFCHRFRNALCLNTDNM